MEQELYPSNVHVEKFHNFNNIKSKIITNFYVRRRGISNCQESCTFSLRKNEQLVTD
jgi:hypothetical protein